MFLGVGDCDAGGTGRIRQIVDDRVRVGLLLGDGVVTFGQTNAGHCRIVVGVVVVVVVVVIVGGDAIFRYRRGR